VAAHAIGLVLMPPEPLPWDRKDFFKETKERRDGDWRCSTERVHVRVRVVVVVEGERKEL